MDNEPSPVDANQARAYERKARTDAWALSATAFALALVCVSALVSGAFIFALLAGLGASMSVQSALAARRTSRHWAAVVKKQDDLDWETT